MENQTVFELETALNVILSDRDAAIRQCAEDRIAARGGSMVADREALIKALWSKAEQDLDRKVADLAEQIRVLKASQMAKDQLADLPSPMKIVKPEGRECVSSLEELVPLSAMREIYETIIPTHLWDVAARFDRESIGTPQGWQVFAAVRGFVKRRKANPIRDARQFLWEARDRKPTFFVRQEERHLLRLEVARWQTLVADHLLLITHLVMRGCYGVDPNRRADNQDAWNEVRAAANYDDEWSKLFGTKVMSDREADDALERRRNRAKLDAFDRESEPLCENVMTLLVEQQFAPDASAAMARAYVRRFGFDAETKMWLTAEQVLARVAVFRQAEKPYWITMPDMTTTKIADAAKLLPAIFWDEFGRLHVEQLDGRDDQGQSDSHRRQRRKRSANHNR